MLVDIECVLAIEFVYNNNMKSMCVLKGGARMKSHALRLAEMWVVSFIYRHCTVTVLSLYPHMRVAMHPLTPPESYICAAS